MKGETFSKPISLKNTFIYNYPPKEIFYISVNTSVISGFSSVRSACALLKFIIAHIINQADR